MSSEPCKHERYPSTYPVADAIDSLVAAVLATATAMAERDEARAALVRVEEVCSIAGRVAIERTVYGSAVHIAAVDAIKTFSLAVREAMESTP